MLLWQLSAGAWHPDVDIARVLLLSIFYLPNRRWRRGTQQAAGLNNISSSNSNNYQATRSQHRTMLMP